MLDGTASRSFIALGGVDVTPGHRGAASESAVAGWRLAALCVDRGTAAGVRGYGDDQPKEVVTEKSMPGQALGNLIASC
jgi:hypothetical protein